ncbi:hypothetical protein EDC94DRAFT_281141 [Helicostylum pulchrum]|nr:hypothetical protein EDC94DRAFT_281141 [Helicostylum pulchrum]
MSAFKKVSKKNPFFFFFLTMSGSYHLTNVKAETSCLIKVDKRARCKAERSVRVGAQFVRLMSYVPNVMTYMIKVCKDTNYFHCQDPLTVKSANDINVYAQTYMNVQVEELTFENKTVIVNKKEVNLLLNYWLLRYVVRYFEDTSKIVSQVSKDVLVEQLVDLHSRVHKYDKVIK